MYAVEGGRVETCARVVGCCGKTCFSPARGCRSGCNEPGKLHLVPEPARCTRRFLSVEIKVFSSSWTSSSLAGDLLGLLFSKVLRIWTLFCMCVRCTENANRGERCHVSAKLGPGWVYEYRVKWEMLPVIISRAIHAQLAQHGQSSRLVEVR